MSGWSRNLGVTSLLAFTIYLSFGLIIPFFPLYVEQLGGGGLEVGILFASFMFTRAFLARPFGKLSDRIGRKRVIISGMFLYALLAYLYTLPDSWMGLFVVRMMQGTASAMVWPVGEALVVDSVPASKRGRSISTYMLVSQLGFVAGPLIGGGLLFWTQDVLGMSELQSYRVPFYFTSAFSLIAAVVGLIFLRDVLVRKKEEVRKRDEERAIRSIRPITRRSLNVLYVNSLMNGLSFSLASVVMVFYMKENFGMNARDYSLLFGLSQAVCLSVVFPVGVLADRYLRKPFIVGGSLVSRVLIVLLSLSSLIPFGNWVAMVSFTLKEMGMQSSIATTRTLQADLVPRAIRGKLIGTIQSFSNIGATVGPIIGGLVWDFGKGRDFDWGWFMIPGDSLPFLISAFLGVVAAFLVLRYVYEPPKGHRSG